MQFLTLDPNFMEGGGASADLPDPACPSPRLFVVPRAADAAACRDSFLVNPGEIDPWWLSILAILPALLCTILIFLDQQITAVIVNRKEHKLKVGSPHLATNVFSGYTLQRANCRMNR